MQFGIGILKFKISAWHQSRNFWNAHRKNALLQKYNFILPAETQFSLSKCITQKNANKIQV